MPEQPQTSNKETPLRVERDSLLQWNNLMRIAKELCRTIPNPDETPHIQCNAQLQQMIATFNNQLNALCPFHTENLPYITDNVDTSVQIASEISSPRTPGQSTEESNHADAIILAWVRATMLKEENELRIAEQLKNVLQHAHRLLQIIPDITAELTEQDLASLGRAAKIFNGELENSIALTESGILPFEISTTPSDVRQHDSCTEEARRIKDKREMGINFRRLIVPLQYILAWVRAKKVMDDQEVLEYILAEKGEFYMRQYDS